ncbi:hypothetical protein [Tardiphaga sp.]|uniref:hypothetical protein n=1 Tax=Tardiphaga sp. TaxID=1926292 RepID=UPI002622FF64|nr:hypothetical protein [Tardiphaga sp.]MDB5620605.1 hypothetical protein [Tardiphaga sp.]
MPTQREFEICAELYLLPEHLYEASEAAAKIGITENELNAARRLGRIEFVDGNPVLFRGWHIAQVLARQDDELNKSV